MKNKVMKETINVLKAMKGINEMNTTEVQFYITDADGFILELRIGIDEKRSLVSEGETRREMYGGCRLTYPALSIGYSYFSHAAPPVGTVQRFSYYAAIPIMSLSLARSSPVNSSWQ